MDSYKTYIENLAENKDGMVFQNASPEHACIVMSTIFKSSEKHLRILAGTLNGKVSNNENPNLKKDYLDSLMKFIEVKKGTLHILLERVDSDFLQSELYSKLNFYSILYPDRIILKKIDEDYNDSDPKFHFTVGDDRMFRFEKDIENHTAIGSFNNPDSASKLIDFFDFSFSSDKAKLIHN